MDYTLRKFDSTTLEAYLNSEDYLNSDIWPISFHRAKSHLNNPRLDKHDVILVIAEANGTIVGYRTVMADYVFNGEKKLKVGWISGTWVDPEYRRQGLATALFDEIYKDWNGQLMYTNYAPASKKVYDKTGAFDVYFTTMGSRFHMKSNLTEILPSRFPIARHIGKVLPTADNFFNHFILPFLTEPGMKSRLAYNMMIKSKLDEEEADLLFEQNLTRRKYNELHWILSFPWVKEIEDVKDEVLNKYFFSAAADVFKLYFCVIYKDGNLVSIVMISIKDAQMKVPYFYSSDLDLALIADLVFTEAWKNSVSYIDVYDEALVKEMKLKTAYFAFSKARERNYMVSKKIIADFPSNSEVNIPDGEGDVVFV